MERKCKQFHSAIPSIMKLYCILLILFLFWLQCPLCCILHWPFLCFSGGTTLLTKVCFTKVPLLKVSHGIHIVDKLVFHERQYSIRNCIYKRSIICSFYQNLISSSTVFESIWKLFLKLGCFHFVVFFEQQFLIGNFKLY